MTSKKERLLAKHASKKKVVIEYDQYAVGLAQLFLDDPEMIKHIGTLNKYDPDCFLDHVKSSI
ncbi:hypothetical protein [Vibrio sp. D420a]|uniref:hypothetical protein n=1 Tax=Vibrio sp. D420a TaxID=2836895 RepID=UPI0025575987|nr:hypothetical protein [Vibrio sp. D420a]